MGDSDKVERDPTRTEQFSREERVDALRSIISGGLKEEQTRDLIVRLESSWRREGEVPQDELDSVLIK